MHLRRQYNWFNSANRASLRSGVMLASIATVSKRIPRKVMVVEGPSILDDFIGALMRSHNDNMELRLLVQIGESGGPAVIKLSR